MREKMRHTNKELAVLYQNAQRKCHDDYTKTLDGALMKAFAERNYRKAERVVVRLYKCQGSVHIPHMLKRHLEACLFEVSRVKRGRAIASLRPVPELLAICLQHHQRRHVVYKVKLPRSNRARKKSHFLREQRKAAAAAATATTADAASAAAAAAPGDSAAAGGGGNAAAAAATATATTADVAIAADGSASTNAAAVGGSAAGGGDNAAAVGGGNAAAGGSAAAAAAAASSDAAAADGSAAAGGGSVTAGGSIATGGAADAPGGSAASGGDSAADVGAAAESSHIATVSTSAASAATAGIPAPETSPSVSHPRISFNRQHSAPRATLPLALMHAAMAGCVRSDSGDFLPLLSLLLDFETLPTTDTVVQGEPFLSCVNRCHDRDLNTFLKALLKESQTSTPIVSSVPEDQLVPLTESAIKDGNVGLLKDLIAKKPELLTMTIAEESKALHLACSLGKYEVAKYLIEEHKLDVNEEDEHMNPPLLLAARKGAADIVELLLQRNVDIDVRNSRFGTNALMLAAKFNRRSLIKYLVEKGSDVNSRDTSGWTPLMGAVKRRQMRSVADLIGLKADVNLTEKYGNSALNMAAREGSLKCVRSLLQANADVNHMAKNLWLPLHDACSRGHTKVAQQLIDAGSEIESPDQYKLTPLLQAVTRGKLGCTRLLLENKADINAVDMTGCDALRRAISLSENKELVDLLLEYKADVNRQDVYGDSQIMAAVQNRDSQVIATLMERGADFNRPNYRNLLPLDYASACDSRVTQFLAKNFKFDQAKFFKNQDISNLKHLSQGRFGVTFTASLKFRDFSPITTTVVCKCPRFGASNDEWRELDVLQNVPYSKYTIDFVGLCMNMSIPLDLKATKMPEKTASQSSSRGSSAPQKYRKGIAMIVPFMHGGSLKGFVSSRKGPLTLRELAKLGLDMTRGVKHLHDNGYLHNDISLRNFLLAEVEGSSGKSNGGADAAGANAVERPKLEKEELCSFVETGRSFIVEQQVNCHTCSSSQYKRCCLRCAATCHKGHHLSEPFTESFYCDCGSGELSTMPCQLLGDSGETLPKYPDEVYKFLTARSQRVVLSDFGLSKLIADCNSSDSSAQQPPPPETKTLFPVRWCAPETLTSRGRVQSRHTDVWMLGIAFWELLGVHALPYHTMTARTVISHVPKFTHAPLLFPREEHAKKSETAAAPPPRKAPNLSRSFSENSQSRDTTDFDANASSDANAPSPVLKQSKSVPPTSPVLKQSKSVPPTSPVLNKSKSVTSSRHSHSSVDNEPRARDSDGRVPCQTSPKVAKVAKKKKSRVKPPRCPTEWRELVRACTARDPSQRPSVDDIISTLERLVDLDAFETEDEGCGDQTADEELSSSERAKALADGGKLTKPEDSDDSDGEDLQAEYASDFEDDSTDALKNATTPPSSIPDFYEPIEGTRKLRSPPAESEHYSHFPEYGDVSSEYGDGSPEYGDGSPEYSDGSPEYGDGSPEYCDGSDSESKQPTTQPLTADADDYSPLPAGSISPRVEPSVDTDEYSPIPEGSVSPRVQPSSAVEYSPIPGGSISPPRDPSVADLRRRIVELERELASLKRFHGPPTTITSVTQPTDSPRHTS